MLTRRRFLRVVGAGGAGVAVVACGDSPDLSPEVGRWTVGSPDEYDEGDLRYFDDGPILVGRDAGGIYAMSAICTHRACEIGDDADEILPELDEIECNCHHSTYTKNGERTGGPARKALQHYLVTLEDGILVADTGVEAAAGDRLTV